MLAHALYMAAAMFWTMLWALALGFGVSACLQVFVSRERMVRAFGTTTVGSVLLATGLGAASSSCSFAAAAAARSAFKKGAALVPALAFMFASTNLVIELGIVLWLFMGWQFVLAEVAGAFVLIAIMWALVALTLPRGLAEEARRHEEGKHDAGCHEHHDHSGQSSSVPEDTHNPSALENVARAYFADWSMLWKEIAVGVLIAGLVMVFVPASWWQRAFLSGGPAPLRTIENCVVGPLIAVASFVCSVGNIPLASELWQQGISFGGVISFIYADLIVLPLIIAYRKYYGAKMAAYITAILFASMVAAGLIVDVLFAALKLTPQVSATAGAMAHAGFEWNYTTWLNLAAIVASAALLFVRGKSPGNDCCHSGH